MRARIDIDRWIAYGIYFSAVLATLILLMFKVFGIPQPDYELNFYLSTLALLGVSWEMYHRREKHDTN